ncbi:MAG: hypothetical protein ACLRFM_03460 [Alphaproteobacteria bacterium]
MKKFLFGLLGVLWAMPSWGVCNLFDVSQSPTTESISSDRIWNRYNVNVSSVNLSGGSWTAKHTDFISPGTYTITINGGDGSAVRGYDGSNISILRIGNGSFTITNPTQIWIFGATPETIARITEIMLEEGSVATEYVPYNPSCGCDGTIVNYTSATGTVVQNGTPTPTNPVEPVFYQQGDMVLRKVGDYADSYDATTGKITRRVGVKVLDGSEEVMLSDGGLNNARFSTSLPASGTEFDNSISTHFGIIVSNSSQANRPIIRFRPDQQSSVYIYMQDINMTLEQFKQWLAEQYANGTPLVVYYPLAEPVEEDWPASYCQQAIKVATTKYVETQFSDLGTRLAAAVATVNTVVTQTIAQAGSIATLQSGKQTRPNDIADDSEKCPAGKQCLLVTDTDGQPHWYEIFDPINRWMEAFFKTNPNGQYEENGVDFRRWQGNPDFRKTYIDGSRDVYVRQWTVASPARTIGGMYQTLIAGDIENAGTWAVEYDGTEGDGVNAGAVYGIAKCTSVAGTFATKLTSAQEAAFYELPAPVGQTDNANYPRENFKQCWCKMTAVGVPGDDGTAANGSVYPVNPSSSAWVFFNTFTAANCANSCAHACAYGVRGDASFRSALFGLSE